MIKMRRTHFYITENHIEYLKELSAKTGLKKSDLIRRMIDGDIRYGRILQHKIVKHKPIKSPSKRDRAKLRVNNR